jgi:hypothetical protein
MVTNTGLVKLVDFGIARTYKVGKKRDTVAMGSENYAAPEQWGKGQTDARSDTYALGATMYHLLANMAPTPAFLPSEPLPLGNYNGAVSKKTIALVEKAMIRDRKYRFQSALEMREVLAEALPMPYVAPVMMVSATSTEEQPTPKPAQPAPPVKQPTPIAARPVVPVPVQPAPHTQPQPHTAPPGIEPFDGSPSVAKSRAAPSAPPAKACPGCGRANNMSARFCVGCGYSFVPLRPAILRVVAPVRAAWEMPVARSPMLLGRASQAENYWPDFDMTFYDEGDYVSRRHARITKGQAGYFVSDLGSSNGTTLNDQALIPQRAYLLRNGDRIKVGLVVIQFLFR